MLPLRLIIIITFLSSTASASLNASTIERANSQSEEEEDEISFPRETYQFNSIVPVVKCPAGTFRGSLRYTRGGKRYFEFQSIPYAEPPKRFERAVRKAPMEDEYDATTEPPTCPQYGEDSTVFTGQEDCLYLSVSTPYEKHCQKEISEGKLLPVMFWIHPGGYLTANASFYKGTYLLDECIVLVTVDYRIGALGFLTTEDNVISGNLGLKDQLLALKWTRRNIRYFRGDPDQVTLAGTSAGAASVTHHICSPASAGLFSKAICMSGSGLDPWGVTEKPRKSAVKLAKKFLCVDLSSEGIKSCLLKQSAKDIVTNQIGAAEFSIRFSPVIEPRNAINPFQTRTLYHLLKTGQINKVPLLTGFVQEEAPYFAAAIISNILLEVVLNAGWYNVAPPELFYDNLDIPEPEVLEISKSIRHFYFNIFPIGELQRQNFMNMITDRGIVQGIYEMVQVISRHVPTYLYLNTYKGGISHTQLYNGYKIPIIVHLDDEQYLFPKFKMWLPGTEQYEFSKNVIELWTNFMRSGRPYGRATENIPWDKVNFQDPVYRRVFNLDLPSKIVRNLWRKRTKFWRGLGIYKYEFAEQSVRTSEGLCWNNSTCQI